MAKAVNLDISERVDITCRKGDSLSLITNITDSEGVAVDLTTYAFKFEVRDSDSSNTAFVNSDATIHLSTAAATDDDQYCTAVGTSAGVLTITAAATETTTIPSGMYVYDIQATVGSTTQTWLHGIFKVNEDVSV
tara:strand:- start:230 stop:634 length:405 start_codon:yes stop_codon:yes gene_type:complete